MRQRRPRAVKPLAEAHTASKGMSRDATHQQREAGRDSGPGPAGESTQAAGKALRHLWARFPLLPAFSSFCAHRSRLCLTRSPRGLGFHSHSLQPGQGGRTDDLGGLGKLPKPTLRFSSSFPVGPGNPHFLPAPRSSSAGLQARLPAAAA